MTKTACMLRLPRFLFELGKVRESGSDSVARLGSATMAPGLFHTVEPGQDVLVGANRIAAYWSLTVAA
jgi:hypothetical protein